MTEWDAIFKALEASPLLALIGLIIYLEFFRRKQNGGEESEQVAAAMTQIGAAMEKLADHSEKHTKLMNESARLHENRGNLCALSAENKPMPVERLLDSASKSEQRDSQIKDIMLGMSQKITKVSDQISALPK